MDTTDKRMCIYTCNLARIKTAYYLTPFLVAQKPNNFPQYYSSGLSTIIITLLAARQGVDI